MFGYKIVKTGISIDRYIAIMRLADFIDSNMVMKDSDGKSENPGYNSEEVSSLWCKYWKLLCKVKR